jgi:hypothetical protein
LTKGGLKRGDKKTKKVIHWADDEGGVLREVLTYEVEKIKRNLDTYKSHKDLEKRERQSEKETHLSQTSTTMYPTTKWRT